MNAAAVVGGPDAMDEAREAFATRTPLRGRIGMPDDIAHAALWLASDDAGFVSGHTLVVDGGLTTGSKENVAPGEHGRWASRRDLVREAGRSGMPSDADGLTAGRRRRTETRLAWSGILGAAPGAGGVVTDDEIRSLAISQRLLGTEEIILIHHTDCGMLTFTDDEFKRTSKTRLASNPNGLPKRSTTSTRTSASRSRGIHASAFVPRKESVRGFVYDVTTGVLREVV